MNAGRLKIARRLVACPKWVWLPGMVALHMDGKYATARIRVDVIDEWCALRRGERWNLRNMLPDLDDDLTRLGVLAVVRLAWSMPNLGVWGANRLHPVQGWACGEANGRIHPADTEIEALLAALEAAPGPCKFGSEQTP